MPAFLRSAAARLDAAMPHFQAGFDIKRFCSAAL
jgi:exonuclease VII small subunit